MRLQIIGPVLLQKSDQAMQYLKFIEALVTQIGVEIHRPRQAT